MLNLGPSKLPPPLPTTSNEKICLIWMVEIPFIGIQNNYLSINSKTLVFLTFSDALKRTNNFHEISDEEPAVV
jgi:hypothetical protein